MTSNPDQGQHWRSQRHPKERMKRNARAFLSIASMELSNELTSDGKPTVFAAGVLLMTREPRKFLLLRHVDRWDVPKGHCEPGETTLECALRETEEETGLSPESIAIGKDFLHTVEYDVDSKRDGKARKRLDLFLGWVDRPFDPALTEHVGFQWFDWDPPHAIQERAIDPLLADVMLYLDSAGC